MALPVHRVCSIHIETIASLNAYLITCHYLPQCVKQLECEIVSYFTDIANRMHSYFQQAKELGRELLSACPKGTTTQNLFILYITLR